MTRVPDQEAKKYDLGGGGAINQAASPATSLSPRHWVRGMFTCNDLNNLIAYHRQGYKEIELIAVMLMTSSKTRAPELKVIARDFC